MKRPAAKLKGLLIKAVSALIIRAGSLIFSFIPKKGMHPRRILVVKLWAIGEVVMATPCLRALKEAFPDAHLAMLVGKRSVDAVSGSPYVDKVIPVDEEIFLRLKLPKLYGLLKSLREEKFDTVVTLHYFLFFNVFAYLTRASVRAGFDRNGEGFPNTHTVPWTGRLRHKVREYLDVVRALGANIDDLSPEVFTIGGWEEKADGLLIELGLDIARDTIIGLVPTGGNNPAAGSLNLNLRKAWPEGHYAGLANLIMDKLGAKVVLLGGKAEETLCSYIHSNTGGRTINLCGLLTLGEYAAMAGRCSLIVTNDSGPMHLAAAVGAPLIAIFGPTDETVDGPYSKKASIIKKEVECRPCFDVNVFPNRARPCEHRRCLAAITPADMLAQVEALLRKETRHEGYIS